MSTLGFYNKNVRNYIDQTRMVDLSELYVDLRNVSIRAQEFLTLGVGAGETASISLKRGML